MFAAGRLGFGKVILVTAGLVGALMLLPSGEQVAPQASTAEPARILPTSTELARFLDSAVQPKGSDKSVDEIVAEIAATPEPGSVAPVSGPERSDVRQDIVTPPIAALPEPREITAARAAVNIRSGPSTRNATLSVLQPIDAVAVLARKGGWAQIKTTEGMTGWVYGRYLGNDDMTEVAEKEVATRTPKKERPRSVEAAPKARVSTQGAIGLRTAPSSGSAKVITVEPGTMLRLVERRKNWEIGRAHV